MKLNLFLFFSGLGLVSSQNAHQGRKTIKAINCNDNSRAPRCQVELEIDVESNDDIDFTLPNGKKISYKKKPSKVEGWAGESPAGGAANIISSDNGFFGSLVDMEDGAWTVCQLRRDFAGSQVIDCKPGSDYPDSEDSEDAEVEVSPASRMLTDNNKVRQVLQEGRSLQITPVIDIMVLWTRDAECNASGMAGGCTTTSTTEQNMRGLINLAFSETNTAFTNSGINAEVRLVHAYRTSYTEDSVAPNAFVPALNALEAGIDDGMTNSIALRDEKCADAVAMIIEDDTRICGLARRRTSSPYILPINKMVSITRWDCATGVYTFAHELGHNFGCIHDRGAESSCDTSAFSNTNFAYQEPTAEFRTIVSTNCDSDRCGSNPLSACARIQYFSNSGFASFGGKATGNANNNNAAQINNAAPIVADYNTCAPSAAPSDAPSGAPSESFKPSAVPSESIAPSGSPSESNSPSGAPSQSFKPSAVPSESMSPSSVPSKSISPSGAPSESIAPSGSPSESMSPSSVPSQSFKPSSSTTESMSPSSVPSKSSSPSAAPSESMAPSGSPSESNSPSSNPSESISPSAFPSESESPSVVPTGSEQPSLSKSPSTAPSGSSSPSGAPTMNLVASAAPSKTPPLSAAGGGGGGGGGGGNKPRGPWGSDPNQIKSPAPSIGSPSESPSTAPSSTTGRGGEEGGEVLAPPPTMNQARPAKAPKMNKKAKSPGSNKRAKKLQESRKGAKRRF
ncbi:unnamed protein product [Cylindrotheca closterium]|uniref:Peptidase M12B domain-containing protein n=1 Tax=Cylindrotheca closterium TaxID=2856 RepID=A0AAD2FZM1_9STRA|nr:unnamed protein product [Cylindrotheca closterium]